jgi:hypothetical protein
MKKIAKAPKKNTKRIAASGGTSLKSVYLAVKAILARHAPPFKLCDVGVRNKLSAQLVVPTPVAIPGAYGGKPVNVQMAAVILQKGYVGFYLMCIYMDGKAKKEISPALMKLLKGKSCFYIKKLDDGLKKDIEAALVVGTKAYRKRGWL